MTNANGAGNFHVYHSTFERSGSADIQIGHASYFSLRDNISRESSNRFVWSKGPGENAIHLTMQRNTIIDTKDDVSVYGDDVGPWILIDNVIRSRRDAAGPVIQHKGPFQNNISRSSVTSLHCRTRSNTASGMPAYSELDTTVVSYDEIATPSRPSEWRSALFGQDLRNSAVRVIRTRFRN